MLPKFKYLKENLLSLKNSDRDGHLGVQDGKYSLMGAVNLRITGFDLRISKSFSTNSFLGQRNLRRCTDHYCRQSYQAKGHFKIQHINQRIKRALHWRKEFYDEQSDVHRQFSDHELLC